MDDYSKSLELQDLLEQRFELLWQIELANYDKSKRAKLHKECLSLQEKINALR